MVRAAGNVQAIQRRDADVWVVITGQVHRRGPCQPALDAAVWRIRYPHRPGGRCAFRSLVTLPCFTRSLRSRSSLSGATMLFTVRTREDWS